jgi:hypothetical protein
MRQLRANEQIRVGEQRGDNREALKPAKTGLSASND